MVKIIRLFRMNETKEPGLNTTQKPSQKLKNLEIISGHFYNLLKSLKRFRWYRTSAIVEE